MSTYFALLTNIGTAKLANAAALGTKLSITKMAVGDGGGVLPTPNPAQTALLNEKRRAALNMLSIDPANDSQIIAEQVIPESEGGFWIREIGLYDDNNDLIAIANCPETYKPKLQEGSGRVQTVRMIIVVSSTDAVTLKIDPSVVLATRTYVDNAVILAKSEIDGKIRDEFRSSDGSKLSGYREITVYEMLSRIRSLADINESMGFLGYNSIAFAEMYNEKRQDNELFIPGGLHSSKELFGVGNNAVAETMLGNNPTSFRAQVVGVSDSKGLAGYGMAEDVLSYRGISGRASITTKLPVFTENTITIKDEVDISKVKIGSVIKTSDGYFGLVTEINGFLFTVDMWANSSTTTGTPAGGEAYLNHVDKTYLSNEVMWIPPTYTGTKIVGAEWDFYNGALPGGERVGFDMAIHKDSPYGMDVAFLARSPSDKSMWNSAFKAVGSAYANYIATDGYYDATASLASYVESTSSEVGFLFNGKNGKSSLKWRYSPNSDVYSAELNRYGFTIKGGKVLSAAISGSTITLDSAVYAINNISNEFNIVLPVTKLTPGQEVEFKMRGINQITVTCSNGTTKVNDLISFSFTPPHSFLTAVAMWDGTNWIFHY